MLQVIHGGLLPYIPPGHKILLSNFKDKRCPEVEQIPSGGNMVAILWQHYIHKSHLCSGQLLDNYHIGAAQALLQRQFPHISGFRNTVIQDSKSLQPFTERYDLQIIHIKMGRTYHWIIVSERDCAEGEIEVYDSLQLSPCSFAYRNNYRKIP